MLKIYVKNLPKFFNRKEFNEIVNFAYKEFFKHKKLKSTYTIFFIFDNLEKNTKGLFSWYDSSYRPKEFEIHITNSYVSKYHCCKTIFHELVHVKQCIKGDMKFYFHNPEKIKWKKTIINTNKIDYKKLPWEKEAFALENQLIQKWQREKKWHAKTNSKKKNKT
jgi:hypothetical protein